MRIRTKITLWTGCLALVVAVCFSVFVFFDLVEQPFRLIDRELRDLSETLDQTVLMAVNHSQSIAQNELSSSHFSRFWIKVVDDDSKILFETPLARKADIPLRPDKLFYFEKVGIPLNQLWIAQEDLDEFADLSSEQTVFRVMASRRIIGDHGYRLLVAKPIPVLINELKELGVDLAVGIVICIIVAAFASYYLAGKILQPFSEINNLIREISENSLEQRIPIGKSRDELSVLAGSLNGMFDRLQHSFDRQKEFVGNAAHELKSPLTVLMLGLEEMLARENTESMQRGLLRHQQILQRLSKLVRNLLEISRLEQHASAKFETLNLNTLIFHVLDEFRDIIQMKNIKVETQLETFDFLGDSEKILRMLINLIDNAIKYNSDDNGYISITTQKTRGTVQLVIANRGQIIPPVALPKIFDQFFRVEQSRSAAYGGVGLGLTIVRHIIELHHGTVAVTSNPEGVTEFIVIFPQDEVGSYNAT